MIHTSLKVAISQSGKLYSAINYITKIKRRDYNLVKLPPPPPSLYLWRIVDPVVAVPVEVGLDPAHLMLHQHFRIRIVRLRGLKFP